jgi:hypothetical protein
MDIDAMGKQLSGLLAFKKRIEELLDGGADAGTGTAAEAISAQIGGLRKDLSDISDDVAALQASKAEATDMSTRLSDMLTWFEANKGGLDVLLSIGDSLSSASAGAPVTASTSVASVATQQVEITAAPEPINAAAAPVAESPAT